jgi:hypothetical protein
MATRRTAVLDPAIERRFVEGIRFIEEFHMGESNVHKALTQLVERLSALEIPYAIIGALALNAYGYMRATVDVDVLLTKDGLDRFKQANLGRGYLEQSPGSRGLRDTANGVTILVVVAGDYPGDGEEKPVSFPDPSHVAVAGEASSLVPLDTLIELKIASGMTAPHRLRDLADVIELIRTNDLSKDHAHDLSPYVRDRYQVLWEAAQSSEE